DALREITRNPPDVVVLDLGLPDLDGAEALKMMRGVSDVPVIVATARDDEAEIVRLLRAGADDYLVKPLSREHLEARLDAVLRRTRRAAAPPAAPRLGRLAVDLDRRGAPQVVRRRGGGAADCVVEASAGEPRGGRREAGLRRPRGAAAPRAVLRVGGLAVALGRREAPLDGAPLSLTRREFDLLAYLAA